MSTTLTVVFKRLENVKDEMNVSRTMPSASTTECGKTVCEHDHVCMEDRCLCADSHLPPRHDGTCTEPEDWDSLTEHEGVLHPTMVASILNLIPSQARKGDESDARPHPQSPRPLLNPVTTSSGSPDLNPVQENGGAVSSVSGAVVKALDLPLGMSVFLILVLVVSTPVLRKLCRRYRRAKVWQSRRQSTFSGQRLFPRTETMEDNFLYGQLTPQAGTEAQGDALEGLLLLNPSRLRIVSRVGDGAFGTVYKGWLAPDEAEDGGTDKVQRETLVAVKVLKDSSTGKARGDFLAECKIMAALHHDNIVTFYGVILADDSAGASQLVTEFAQHGDLATALRKNDPTMRDKEEDFVLIQQDDLLSLCRQVAAAMEYLSNAHFIHRDLAARNCLLAEGLHVKVSDFGMSRDVYTSDSYQVEGSRLLPVRWMSPECLRYGQFSVSSDVWAFGVLLWEVYTYGKQPYCGYSNIQVMQQICQGNLLQRPDDCPDVLYMVMEGCWKLNPRDRLTFPQICKVLMEMPEDVSELDFDDTEEDTEGFISTWDEDFTPV